MAAFLSRSVSNAKTNESPSFACQNAACAAAFPPPLTPQSWNSDTKVLEQEGMQMKIPSYWNYYTEEIDRYIFFF